MARKEFADLSPPVSRICSRGTPTVCGAAEKLPSARGKEGRATPAEVTVLRSAWTWPRPAAAWDCLMAKHIEDLSQFAQNLGVAGLALLLVPIVIAAAARNITLTLAATLLSIISSMLFVAPASAIGGLALASGLGSFLVALESIVARGRAKAINTKMADLTNRVNQLESAEQRRLALEIKARGQSREVR